MALAADEARPSLLHIDIARPDEHTVVVTPAGEADICTVADLRRALCDAIGMDSPHVIVDLDRLSFMDASTLGVLVEAHRRASAMGRTLRVRCRTRQFRRLLTMTRLDGMLDPSGADPLAPSSS